MTDNQSDRTQEVIKVVPNMEIKYTFDCPYCGKYKHSVTHLIPSAYKSEEERKKAHTFGTWYCDECGGGVEGEVKEKIVYLKKNNKRLDKCIVFLKNENVLLLVEGMYFDGVLDQEHQQYHYDEHTCPTNYIRSVKQIIDLEDGSTDPHGIFKFMGAIPFVDTKDMTEEQIKALLPKPLEE